MTLYRVRSVLNDTIQIAKNVYDIKEGGMGPCHSSVFELLVAESQPWSVAEWAVALRFDNPRATVLVLLLG